MIYEIIGDDLQLVEVTLKKNQGVVAEAGAMNYKQCGIEFTAKMGDGSESGAFSKLASVGKRLLTKESLFLAHFTNSINENQHVGFSSPYPGKVLAIDMNEIDGKTIYCQKGAFLCASLGTKLSVAFTKRLGAGFFGGEGFILQKLYGHGMVFIQAGGTLIEKQLNNETLQVDTGCLVGFTKGVDFNVETAGSNMTMLFGGEGLFLTTLKGTGTVWLQSMPFSRLSDRILKNAPKQSNK
ncbi:MAG: TIGR00266 family protein [Mariprofundales bacterium]